MFTEEADVGISAHFRQDALSSPDEAGSAPSVTVLEIGGALTSSTLSPVQNTLLAAISAPGPVVLDLRAVPVIDSAGLSLLLRVYRELAREGRPLTLRIAAGSQPERVLRLGNFDAIAILAADTGNSTPV